MCFTPSHKMCRRSPIRSHFDTTICGHLCHLQRSMPATRRWWRCHWLSSMAFQRRDFLDRSTLFVQLRHRTRKILTKLININTSNKLHTRKVYLHNFASLNRSIVSTLAPIVCCSVHLFCWCCWRCARNCYIMPTSHQPHAIRLYFPSLHLSSLLSGSPFFVLPTFVWFGFSQKKLAHAGIKFELFMRPFSFRVRSFDIIHGAIVGVPRK